MSSFRSGGEKGLVSAWWSSGFISTLSLSVLVSAGVPFGCGHSKVSEPIYKEPSDGASNWGRLLFRTSLNDQKEIALRPEERMGVAPDPKRGCVYVGNRYGRLFALDQNHGGVIWEMELGDSINSQPLLANDSMLLVGTDDGALLAIDVESQKKLWEHRTDGVVRQLPLMHDDLIYFANSRDEIWAIDRGTGAYRWQYSREFQKDFTSYGRPGLVYREVEDELSPEPGIVYTGFDDGRVVALGANSGAALWVTNISRGSSTLVDVGATPVLVSGGTGTAQNRLYTSSVSDGIFALDLETGSVQWRLPMEGVGGLVRYEKDGLLVASSSRQGIFGVFDEGDHGRVWWHQQLDPGALSEPVAIGNSFFVSHSEQGLMMFERSSGDLLARLTTGSGISSAPQVYLHEELSRLYAVSNRGYLFAFELNR